MMQSMYKRRWLQPLVLAIMCSKRQFRDKDTGLLCNCYDFKSLWGYWYPCFWLLKSSALGFKTRVESILPWCLTCVQWIPQIHLWCNTWAWQSRLFDPHTCTHTSIGWARIHIECAASSEPFQFGLNLKTSDWDYFLHQIQRGSNSKISIEINENLTLADRAVGYNLPMNFLIDT